MKDVYVEIVKYEGDIVERRMGPMSEHKAGRVEDGANINLNHTEYFTRKVYDKESDDD